MQFASGHDAKFWVNHPGEAEPGGEQRPSYWSGNGVLPRVMQVENHTLQLYQLAEDDPFPCTDLYLPAEAFDQVITTSHGCLIRAGNAFAAIGCSAPLCAVTAGMTAGNEYRAKAHRVAWYIEVGHGDDMAFAAFCQRMAALEVRLEGETAIACTRSLSSCAWTGRATA